VRTRPKTWSGPCPDLTANQRSRDGLSSAAIALSQPASPANNHGLSRALDSGGSAPLSTPPTTDGTTRCRLLTARTVAELLDVCAETVLRWIRNGQLPAVRLPGGAVRIIESDLDDWLKSRATPARGVLATTTGAAGCERYPESYDGRR
jgi:excisionase family DNA binding protein